MPIDTQILAAGTSATPVDYRVPNAQEILLKAVNAVFDGSGAGGDYIPEVVIESDGGVVIARAADPANVVTAGNDAEVSWFPGVKNGAAAPSGTSIALATGDNGYTGPVSGQVIPAGGSAAISFPTVDTTDAAIMSWQTVVNPNDRLHLAAQGVYHATMRMDLPGTAAINPTYITVNNDVVIQQEQTEFNSPQDGAGGFGQVFKGDSILISTVGSGQDSISLVSFNNDAANKAVDLAYLRVVFLGVLS